MEKKKRDYDDIPMEAYRATVSQYDSETDELIGTHTGTFYEVFSSIKDYNKYNYRLPFYEGKAPFGRVYGDHFGVKTSCIMGLAFCERDYMNAFLNNKLVQSCYKEFGYFEKWNGSINHCFQLLISRRYWMQLLEEQTAARSKVGFNEALDDFLNRHPDFHAISDLNEYKGVSGCYLLVLDKYKLYYIGQAQDIRKRIMRHWSRADLFMEQGIDIFKAFDTTRIYVNTSMDDKDAAEYSYISELNPRYIINFFVGGKPEYFLEQQGSIFVGNAFSRLKEGEDYWDMRHEDFKKMAQMRDMYVLEL